jgi:predicted PurR-regulated permease PerM
VFYSTASASEGIVKGSVMSVDRRVMKAATLLAFLAVGAILYFAAAAFIPVVLALFFTVLLSPAVEALQRLRIPRTLAAAIVMLALMLALMLAGVVIVDGISVPAKEWLARAPQTIHKIELRIRPVRSVIAQVDAVKQRANQLTQGAHAVAPPLPPPSSGGSYAFEITQSLLESLTVIPLTLFFWPVGRRCSHGWRRPFPAVRGPQRASASPRPFGPSSGGTLAALRSLTWDSGLRLPQRWPRSACRTHFFGEP